MEEEEEACFAQQKKRVGNVAHFNHRAAPIMAQCQAARQLPMRRYAAVARGHYPAVPRGRS